MAIRDGAVSLSVNPVPVYRCKAWLPSQSSAPQNDPAQWTSARHQADEDQVEHPKGHKPAMLPVAPLMRQASCRTVHGVVDQPGGHLAGGEHGVGAAGSPAYDEGAFEEGNDGERQFLGFAGWDAGRVQACPGADRPCLVDRSGSSRSLDDPPERCGATRR
jgi:hypothetical protein